MRHIVTGVLGTLSLSWRLFARTIGAKYRKSFLGYFWLVAPALFITAGGTLAHRAGILNPGDTGLPYPIFVLLGTLIWQVFAEAYEVPYQAFEGARSYLTRVNFRREAIILAQAFETGITTTVRLLLVLVVLAIMYGPSLRMAGWVSLCFAGALLLGLGIGALIAPFTLLFSDLQQTIKLVLSYGLFLTPALFQPQGNGLFATIVRLNPVSPLMVAAREAVAGTPIGDAAALAWVVATAAVMTVLGFAMVRATAPIVIERMLLGGR
jgi:lipopolysaccharide transport system permease protein